MSIRNWPEGERPREKLLARGSGALSDAELLAVLLGSGSRGKDAIALGRELLTNAGSLGALLSGPEQQIRAGGLGPAKRARIAAALELARRSLSEELQQRQSLGNPRDSGEFLRARLRHLPYEVFGCLYLDNACAVIFAHNHPSGVAEPSAADRAITHELRNALQLVGVRVLDHLVIGSGEPVSMAARGLL